MRVLSLFDGMAGARLAIDAAGMECEEYIAVELEPKPRAIADHTYKCRRPTHDAYDLAAAKNLGDIDLMVAGFPCQDFAPGGKNLGFATARGRLYETMLRWRDSVKPKHWIFENVMPKSPIAQKLNADIGTEFVLANSMNYGAQHRRRAFWTSHIFRPLTEPSPVRAGDILTDEKEQQYPFTPLEPCGNHIIVIGATRYYPYQAHRRGRFCYLNDGTKVRVPSSDTVTDRWCKMPAIRPLNHNRVPLKNGGEKICRRLSAYECAAFQNIPDEYIRGAIKAKVVTKAQAAHAIGNGFDIAVVADIIKQVVGGLPTMRYYRTGDLL